MRADTKTMLESKLGVGEGQALAMAIEGGFTVGDRLERKLSLLFGNENAAWNFCQAIHGSVELSQATQNAITAAFGNIHGAELIRVLEQAEARTDDTDVLEEPAVTFTPSGE